MLYLFIHVLSKLEQPNQQPWPMSAWKIHPLGTLFLSLSYFALLLCLLWSHPKQIASIENPKTRLVVKTECIHEITRREYVKWKRIMSEMEAWEIWCIVLCQIILVLKSSSQRGRMKTRSVLLCNPVATLAYLSSHLLVNSTWTWRFCETTQCHP